jgi:probable addiction module antidote protein
MLANNKRILAHLFRDDPGAIAPYLTEKLRENDLEAARTALSLTMQAQNVQILGRDAGIRRDTLYKTFGGKVDPQLSRIMKFFGALNLRLQVVPSAGRNDPVLQESSPNDNKILARQLRDNPELIAGYLTHAFEANEFEEAVFALREVTHAQNVSSLGRAAGIPRRTFYKTFSGEVDPQLSRILKVFVALNIRFTVVALPHRQRSPRPTLGRPRKRPTSDAE